MKKQNSPNINKLKHPIENNEIDLCADINQQQSNIDNYRKHFNEYCSACNTEPCSCHLIALI